MSTPALREWVAEHGADALSMTQPEFARFVSGRAKAQRESLRKPGSNLNEHEF